MNPLDGLLALLVFPGLLYALPMGWLMAGSERRIVARLQGRIGPPVTQAFYDCVKLLAKWPVARPLGDTFILTLLPLLAVGCALGALALLPALGGRQGFVGDLILFVGLLEMAPLCAVLAGFASRSVYGAVGAAREAVLGISGNVPFLAALLALAVASGSLSMARIAQAPWAVRLPALLAILACLPVKLRLNPFSVANAEQEILAGPLTEYDGPRLALWELAHGLEWVALTGLVAAFLVPVQGLPRTWGVVLFALASFALVPLLATLAAATARLKVQQATRFLWRWASLAAAVAVIVALIRHGRA
jgi:NADH-quinone oxidoreductase subunit H